MPASSYQPPARRNYFGAFAGAPRSMGAPSVYSPAPYHGADNSWAGSRFASTGQMPTQTYGGLFGAGQPNPSNVPTSAQTLGYATGNQYAPMHQAPLAMAPTNQQGYMQQMAQQNPGGQFFGGALPAMGMSAGGQQRPMFMGAPAEQGPQFPNFADWNRARGGPSNRPITQQRQQADAAGHAQYMQQWNQGMAGRRGMVQNNAMDKGAARRARMGIGDPLDMAMRGNSDIAGMMGMGQLGLQGQQMQNQLGWGALAQQHQAAQFQQHAALMQHIAGADLPPGVKQSYMDQLMGSMGLHGGQSGGPTGTGQQRANWHLTGKEQGEYRALKTPQEREAWLNQKGIVDPTTRSYMLGESGRGMGVGGQSPQGFLLHPSIFGFPAAFAGNYFSKLLEKTPVGTTRERPKSGKGPSVPKAAAKAPIPMQPSPESFGAAMPMY